MSRLELNFSRGEASGNSQGMQAAVTPVSKPLVVSKDQSNSAAAAQAAFGDYFITAGSDFFFRRLTTAQSRASSS